jgi:hypothetical protein
MKILIATFCLLASAFGQTVQITDKSPSDSPVTFKGTITFNDTAPANCAITAHNGGSRSIVAFVVQLDVIPADGYWMKHPSGFDHFFAPDDMLAVMSPAGKDFNPEFPCGFCHSNGERSVYDPPTPQSPSMTITTTMVQFDDGSVWGDPAAIKEVMFQRSAAITYLQSLKASSNLTQALSAEPPLNDSADSRHVLSTRELTWAILRDKTTPQAQADELNRRLAIAQEHASWMVPTN